jgi:SAM-dependent methyltransferase
MMPEIVRPPRPRYHGGVGFKDHFSGMAAAYGRARPRYPPELAAYLAGLVPRRTLALDLATGNGQAAVDLAAHFELVLASDASASQLAHATAHPRVRYLRHGAERLPLAAGTVDLVAVAQAAHWFDFARFYPEAERVLRPGGVLALWTYGLFRVDAATDRLVDAFYRDVVGPYWPPERHYVDAGYRTLPFPLERLAAPRFALTVDWSLGELMDYIGTWSAVSRYRTALGADPLPGLGRELAGGWATGVARPVRFDLHLLIGRV